MATTRHPLTVLLLLTLLLPAAPALGTDQVAPAGATPRPAGAAAALVRGLTDPPLRVAVANAFEGSMRSLPADLRDGTDRRRLVARILGRGVPDVVLLQEVRGSAGVFARLLSRATAARGTGDARFDVVGGTALRWSRGACDGPRSGRYRLLRGAAVLVNEATVAGVLDQGTVRTWGRWHPEARHVTGRGGYACAAQPWVRLALRAAGARPVVVTSVHVSPLGAGLKQRAVSAVQDVLDDLRAAHPRDRAVLGGDLNLTRCALGRSHCRVRPAHDRLATHGWRDALLTEGGPGTTGRVEFLYTSEPVRAAWIDACQRAYRALRTPCRDGGGFADHARFAACQERSLHHGRPGGGCPPAAFGRYYSDHPAVVATLGASTTAEGFPVTRR